MSKRFRKTVESAGEEGSGHINVVPLIDVVFILLLFFIVTSVFVDETGVEIDRPRAATQSDLDKNSILIGITSSGQVFHGGREIGVAGVRSVVGKLAKENNTPVIIQADKAAPTDATVSVLDEAKLGGAKSVFVSTINQ